MVVHAGRARHKTHTKNVFTCAIWRGIAFAFDHSDIGANTHPPVKIEDDKRTLAIMIAASAAISS
jgi:hypothetical protein